MAKEQIGSNATFSGPQKGLTTIGDFAYAYSGSVSPNSNAAPETTALLFTTGSQYIAIKLNWTCSSTSATVDQFFRILMNDSIIFDSVAEDDETATGQSPLEFIIPPLTKFEVKVGNAATSPFTVLLMGKVYDQ